MPLRPGDRVVMYTDGLIERRADSISDALREFTSASVPAGPDAAAHADRIELIPLPKYTPERNPVEYLNISPARMILTDELVSPVP